MNSLRKIIVVSVMSVTVLSMSMVVAPSAGAVAQAGDLIKMDGLSSVYYLGADGKRYVFPNESTYFSWYSDFSGVVTIPQSELETYPLGANVTVRPGTKLVKITTDPKVYAVEPGGILKWVPSEAVASALFGANWNRRIIDVSDAFFTNYTVSSVQVSATAYPAGSLVKFGTDATVYYIDASGNARAISNEGAFVANRFSWDDVISSALTKPAAGTAITAAESGITDTSEGAGGTAGAGTGLTVSLAGDTAASTNIPSGATLVPFMMTNLSASADGAVTVQSMVFTRTGTGPTTDFDGGYLFVGDTRLGNKSSLNASDHTLTFNALNLSIPAGMTKQVTLKMNVQTGDRTGNHAFKLAAASAVGTNGAVVSGSFPVQGNLMSLSAVDAATVTFTGVDNDSTKKVGETNVILGEFTIGNGNTEIVNIHRIMLKNFDTATDAAISNVSLDLDGTLVKTGVAMSDKSVDFMLDTPFELGKGKTITAIVRGDIVGDIGKIVQFYLKNVADVDVRGTAYGNFYSATITNYYGSASSGSVVSGGDITIQGSEIDVSFDGPAAAEFKDDVKDVVLANFKIKSNNLGVAIDTLTVTLADNIVCDLPMINLEMVDSANNLAYSVSDPAATSSAHALAFENINLAAGTQYNFQIRGDIQDLTDAGCIFAASIVFTSGFTANFTDSDETAVVPATDLSQTTLTGKNMTVAAPAVIFSKVTTNDLTVVKSATGVLLFKGKITANNTDNLKVSKLTFETGGAAATQLFSTDFTKLYVYKVNSDSTETLLDTETSVTDDSIGFSGFTLDIPKGLSNGVMVALRADVKGTPAATSTYVQFSDTDSEHTVRDTDNNAVTSITGNDNGVVGHKTTVAALGTYTIDMDTAEAGVNADKNILAGAISKLGRIKLTAANEVATLEDLVLQNVATTPATNQTLARVYLYSDKDMTTEIGHVDVDGSNYALFENINIDIPTTGSTYLYVGGLIKAYDKSATPGVDATAQDSKNVKIQVADPGSGYDTKAIGKNTGTTLSDSGLGTTKSATSTVLGSIMSAISTTFANATLVNGTAKDIFSFKVTAPASSNVDYAGDAQGFILDAVTFNIATSGCSISDVKIFRTGGANGEQDVTETLTGTTIGMNFASTYDSTEVDRIVRPGDTAEYIVRATIGNSDGTGDSLQVTLESLDTNMKYKHTTTGATTYTSPTVSPLISGISSVRGGTLSN